MSDIDLPLINLRQVVTRIQLEARPAKRNQRRRYLYRNDAISIDLEMVLIQGHLPVISALTLVRSSRISKPRQNALETTSLSLPGHRCRPYFRTGDPIHARE